MHRRTASSDNSQRDCSRRTSNMVAPGCLEHPARSLGNCCSIHLSYGAPDANRPSNDSISRSASGARVGYVLVVALVSLLALVIVFVIAAATTLTGPADAPDDAGLRDLNERGVGAA